MNFKNNIMVAHIYKGHLLLLFIILSALVSLCCACVPGCQCTMASSAKKQKGRKVDCAQHAAPLKTLANIIFPPDTVHLNLAHNALVILKQGFFIQLSSLQKLNLSSNQITIIEPGTFDGLRSLKKLDLSNNHIGTINSHMFTGLPSLEKLFLSSNRISVIPDGTFNDLRSLKRIEFNSEYLRCDCHLKWILKWTKQRHVQISGSTVCALPVKMKGQPLSKLRRKDLHCDHKLQLPIFDIRPSESQLVFKGDKLPFECHASVMPGKMEIAWVRGGHLVTTNKTSGVFVYTSHNLDHTVINHRLVVESLDFSHAGEWSCVVSTDTENLTKTVHVEVRTPEVTHECPSVTNRTAKGIYTWDKSMAGLIVSQPCKKGEKGLMATHKCGVEGRWKNMNISTCGFIKDITRKLARLAKADKDTTDIPTLVHGMNKALAFLAQNNETLDSFDIMYMLKIMDNLLHYVISDTTVASLFISLVSNASSLPQQVLEMAQIETRSPQRMVRILEQMSRHMSFQNQNWRGFSENILVTILSYQFVAEGGVSCALQSVRNNSQHGFTEDSFHCSNFVTEMNAAVYIHIPALQTRRSQSHIEDSISILSTTTDEDLDKDDGVENKISSNWNSSFTSNYTAAELDSVTSSLEEERTKFSLSNLGPESTSAPSSRPDVSTFQSFSLEASQFQALNISSLYLSKLSKSKNSSSAGLMSLSSLLDMSSKDNFPDLKNLPLTSHKFGYMPSPSNEAGVYVILYRNGQLFPVIQSELSDDAFKQGSWAVVAPIVAVSLGGQARNISQPFVATFEIEETRRPIKAAYYDFEIISGSGYGGWRTDGCEITQYNGSLITVRLQHLTYFTILQDLSYVHRNASFAMEPVIYVGSGVCMFCLIIVIVTFIACFRSIGIPKKIKHSVVNVCITTLFLMTAFVLGINRIDTELPCKITGICIHYLTLCAIFWITVTSNIIYKKFIKASRPPEPPPELVPMPLPPKPILQFYLVGYGVPVIICGITTAVNLKFYTGLQYCFLDWEPSLGALYAPVALLVAWNLVLFMRISCVVKSDSETDSEPSNEHDNEIHTNEIELIPSQPDTTITTHIICPDNTSSNNNNVNTAVASYRRRYSQPSNDEESVTVKSIPDQERTPLAQLISLVVILYLFIVMWMCAALAIAKSFQLIPHQDIVFSYIYGLMSSLFGIFMIFYFCVTRKDTWLSWKHVGKCTTSNAYAVAAEAAEAPSEQLTNLQFQANGGVTKSNSNSNLSLYSQKSSNITKAYNMKNNGNSKNSNINLIMPNSSETSFASAQENFPNFFNPRQNGAAKKFWQKNRHHNKIMNKDINRDLNRSLTDNNSVVEVDQHQLSNDTSSDANTHLSKEIHLHTNDKQSHFTGSKEILVHFNNCCQGNAHNLLTSSFGTVSVEHNGQNTWMKSQTPDAGQPPPKNDPQNSLSGMNANLSRCPRSPSSGSLGSGAHASAFTPVQPRNSNTLSQLYKPEENEVEVDQQWQDRNVMKNQLTSSQISEKDMNKGNGAGQRPPNPGVAWNPLHSNLPPLPINHPIYSFTPPPAHSQQPYLFGNCPPAIVLNPHIFTVNQTHQVGLTSGQQQSQLPPFNIPPSPYLIQSQARGPIQMVNEGSGSSLSQSNPRQCISRNSWHPVSGGDSSDSSRPRQKRTHSGNSHGRTVTYAPRSPVHSDSQAYEPQFVISHSSQQGANKAHSLDSDHHSDPTHRKKHHRSDRHAKNKLTNKQRSLGWDEQFKGRPSKVNYVYVNHVYRDKIMYKLIKQASESDDLAKKAFWLPRSASEYDRLTQKGFCSMADDSSSSSLDEDSLDDNIWIRQSSGSDFHKKETSV